jgi:phage terminase large subunit GpA-like protein
MRKQTVFSFSDLRHVSIECHHCSTRVILDLGKKRGFAQKHDSFTPARCPSCEVAYDTSIRPNIDSLQKIYETLTASETDLGISFITERAIAEGRPIVRGEEEDA